MDLTLTLSEENYLKAIYALSIDGSASTSALAEYMETKASSVTDMIKKLHQKSLVNYKKYQGTTLTKTGRSTAVYIIRKHRLWEAFLVDKLKFGWEEVHEIAEQLEHIKSQELINRLDAFLGYPKRDPHGDPIPDRDGNLPDFKPVALSVIKIGEKVVITGVDDSSRSFLEYLDKQEIQLGDELTVNDILPYDSSMVVIKGKREYTLSKQICDNILVKA